MNTPALNPHLLSTPFPGIAEINARADRLRQEGKQLVNLGQAIPWYPPPSLQVIETVRTLDDPSTHKYSPDLGLPALRSELARVLRERLGHSGVSGDGLMITAGANSAYLIAVMGILAPKDRMGLLTPWYFNHEMAVRLLGRETIPIPLFGKEGFSLDPERILSEVDRHQLAALSIVTPNNPTGVTYDSDALKFLASELHRRKVWLIVDETYVFFPGTGRPAFSLGCQAAENDRLIIIGSFSKTFAMTGWRIGYMAARPEIITQLLKIQDTMLICASHPGQNMTLACLRGGWNWLEERIRELEKRRKDFVECWPKDHPWRLVSSGLFFAWLEGPSSGRAAVLELLETERVILIPGDIFGNGLEQTIRVSLGCVDETAFTSGSERLKRGLHGISARESF